MLDQGWHEFRRQLEYKSEWNGGYVLGVNPQYTSQICSVCSHKSKENRLTQSEFACQACGFEINADVNASRNILAAGLGRVSLPSELRKRSATGTRGKARASTYL